MSASACTRKSAKKHDKVDAEMRTASVCSPVAQVQTIARWPQERCGQAN
jgi:hypothetical protein